VLLSMPALAELRLSGVRLATCSGLDDALRRSVGALDALNLSLQRCQPGEVPVGLAVRLLTPVLQPLPPVGVLTA
jgi:hypothetical protein